MTTEVGSLTDCTICMEEISDPRFLPCHHTFCLSCIDNLRLSHQNREAPCPLCRSPFNESAADLRINVYVEELVSLTRDAEVTEYEMEKVRDELIAVNTQLKETEDARQEAIDEQRRLGMALEETRTQLTELENHSLQTEQQLESRLREMEQNLSASESRESCFREQQRETFEQLKDAERRHEAAKIEAETCRHAREDAEALLADEKQSSQSLCLQLQHAQQETHQQLKDAERSHKEAKDEFEACQRARNGIEASLAKKTKKCRSLHQQLQQTQQETCQQLNDAQRRHKEAKDEFEACQRAKNVIDASLGKKTKKCRSLHEQLQQMQRETDEHTKLLKTELDQSKREVTDLERKLAIDRMKLEEQDDYRKSHAEVTRVCLVLLWLLALAVTGATILLEGRTSVSVKACNEVARKVEENTIKLSEARFETRDKMRLLNDCSDQLASTKQALHATEMKLKDANEVLSAKDGDKTTGKPVKATSDSATKQDSVCDQQLREARANLHTQKMMWNNCSSSMVQERESKLTEAATAKECALHVKWLQQLLEEHMALVLNGSVQNKEPTGVNKQGCNCDRRSKGSNDDIEALNSSEVGSTPVETAATSDSANARGEGCNREASEARAMLKTQEMTLKNCSSYRTKCDEELATALDTIHLKTQELDKYWFNLVKAQGQVWALTDCLSETHSVDETITIIKNLKFRQQEYARELDQLRDDLKLKTSSLIQCENQAKDIHKNLTTLSSSMEECAKDLKSRPKVEPTGCKECVRKLNQSEDHLKLKTSTLTKCENQLRDTSSSLQQCTKDLKSRPKVEDIGLKKCECNDKQRSTKSKGETAKLTKCNEDLATATDTVRWKTQQLNKCADNLVKTRGEVQLLTARLSETYSDHYTTVKNLEIRHEEKLENIISDLQLRCQRSLDQAAFDCNTDERAELLLPICQSIFVVLLILLILVCLLHLIPEEFNPHRPTGFAYYLYKLRYLIGIRGRHPEFRIRSNNRYR